MEFPTFEREAAFWSEGFSCVAGVDEVGRGPLAGPVVAAAVIFAPGADPIEGLRDSKQLSASHREELAGLIRERARAWGIGAASTREIDRSNILRATGRAMRRALAHLPLTPDRLLVDGTPLPELRMPHEAVVGGDAVSQSIAAASVLAKVLRDHLMTLLDVRYPVFHWAENKGYGTADHLKAIREAGLTAHHRRSVVAIGQLDLF